MAKSKSSKKKRSAKKHHFWWCTILFSLTLIACLFNAFVRDEHPVESGNVYTLTKPLKLGVDIADDSVFVRLKKGQDIKILGMHPNGTGYPVSFLVEAPNGSRGWVPDRNLGVPMVAIDEETGQVDTVKVLAEATFGYECLFPNKEKKEVSFDYVRPVLPDSLNIKPISTSNMGSLYMTPKKFEREFIGKTMEENERRFRHAVEVAVVNDSLRACYPIKLVDSRTGKNYRPIVTYDDSLRAVSFTRSNLGDRSDWVIKLLPLFGPILDCGFFSNMIDGSFFEIAPVIDQNNTPWWAYILMVLVVVFGLLWFYATPSLPILLIGILMHIRQVFYPFSNSALRWMILIIAPICSYIWFVLLLAWGMHWTIALITFVVTIRMIGLVTIPLYDSTPCLRCLNCRRIETMEFDHSNFERDYTKWMRETEYVKLIDQQEKRWSTWTDVTTTWSDGSKTHSQENYRRHKSIISTKLYDDYNVLYRVDVYRNTYKCAKCGNLEYTFPERYTEIDRKYMGTHTETTESQKY